MSASPHGPYLTHAYWPRAVDLMAKRVAQVLLIEWVPTHDQELRDEIAERIERAVPAEKGVTSRIGSLLFGSAKGAMLSAAAIARGGPKRDGWREIGYTSDSGFKR